MIIHDSLIRILRFHQILTWNMKPFLNLLSPLDLFHELVECVVLTWRIFWSISFCTAFSRIKCYSWFVRIRKLVVLSSKVLQLFHVCVVKLFSSSFLWCSALNMRSYFWVPLGWLRMHHVWIKHLLYLKRYWICKSFWRLISTFDSSSKLSSVINEILLIFFRGDFESRTLYCDLLRDHVSWILSCQHMSLILLYSTLFTLLSIVF